MLIIGRPTPGSGSSSNDFCRVKSQRI